MIAFNYLVPHGDDIVGYLPTFLSARDPRPAREQLDLAYGHGGGWRPMQGWRFDVGSLKLTHPGDPPLKPGAWAKLRDEVIYVYPHAWVLIVQADGSFEVARMD